MIDTDPAWDALLPRVRRAAAACAAHDLLRVRVEEPGFAVEIARSARRPVVVPTGDLGSVGDGEPRALAGSDGARVGGTSVRADIVGIVRLSRPVVRVGSLVAEDRELAFVESLGIRNPIRARDAGRVVEVLVRDGDPVEYGQTLFVLAPEVSA